MGHPCCATHCSRHWEPSHGPCLQGRGIRNTVHTDDGLQDPGPLLSPGVEPRPTKGAPRSPKGWQPGFPCHIHPLHNYVPISLEASNDTYLSSHSFRGPCKACLGALPRVSHEAAVEKPAGVGVPREAQAGEDLQLWKARARGARWGLTSEGGARSFTFPWEQNTHDQPEESPSPCWA